MLALDIGFTLRMLQSKQNTPPNLLSILYCFQPGRMEAPFGMTEMVINRSRRQNQKIIVHSISIVKQNGLRLRVYVYNFGVPYARVGVSFQKGANGRSNLCGS